jgi:hypothetical protein
VNVKYALIMHQLLQYLENETPKWKAAASRTVDTLKLAYLLYSHVAEAKVFSCSRGDDQDNHRESPETPNTAGFDLIRHLISNSVQLKFFTGA